jgi:phytoene synthase
MRNSSVNPGDLAACRDLLCGGSRSFFAASLLLPARVRDPATALYAFCRVADDAIDLGADPVAALAVLNDRLDAAYAGAPHDHPIDRAFAATVADHAIPRTLPAALIEGLAWDSESRRYANFASLQDYAARVAGAVGVMMALIMGVRDSASLARAGDLGVAMQLTNIARDVGEDARAGRLFLPLDWLADAGLDAGEFLARPAFSPALCGVIQRLLAEAEFLYARAGAGILRLPLDCRTGIAAARRIYAEIGQKLGRLGYDSVTHRARVPGHKKLVLAARAAADTLGFQNAAATAPPLPANLYLVTAAAIDPPEPVSSINKLLDMFERLERTQRESRARLTA